MLVHCSAGMSVGGSEWYTVGGRVEYGGRAKGYSLLVAQVWVVLAPSLS